MASKRSYRLRGPISVKVNPSRKSTLNECFFNVEDHVKRNGGSQIYGWRIRKCKLMNFVEAEFHSVWCNHNNKLIDITHNIDESSSIIFVSDSELIYDGTVKRNIRRALEKNLALADYILFSELEDKISIKQLGNVTRSSKRAVFFSQEFLKYKGLLTNALINFKLNDYGECCPGNIYKNCHHFINKKIIKEFSDLEGITLESYEEIFSVL
ncbi:hypothetical protein GCL60_09995 [Silvanigrella paludirubra]|uniref:Uncharacterized protein n=1 Tax=Silvanigrella paludirubra TaxID=2499159 RepID=A0A6N6VTI4_9BACT|nr:hypothetical protein [Silvanigrella paludirubra]KAB8039178.1 hypothetical protein GCL60_09995 [Silvanigrella paludirubra]